MGNEGVQTHADALERLRESGRMPQRAYAGLAQHAKRTAMIERCQAYGEEAVDRLAHWMRSDDGKVSRQAANDILDRGYGRATQAISSAEGGPLEVIIRRMGGEELPPRNGDVVSGETSAEAIEEPDV